MITSYVPGYGIPLLQRTDRETVRHAQTHLRLDDSDDDDDDDIIICINKNIRSDIRSPHKYPFVYRKFYFTSA